MVIDSNQSDGNWRLEGLGAEGPETKLKDKLMLFGQFVGDWEIVDARYMQKDGSWAEMRGEVHFGWILGGTAIQDVWLGHKLGVEQIGMRGTTIRFYDSKIDAWCSTWLSPLKAIVQFFIGRKIEDTIVLELQNPIEFPEHWVFSKITPTSFRWHAEETRDAGKTWVITEEMQLCRK